MLLTTGKAEKEQCFLPAIKIRRRKDGLMPKRKVEQVQNEYTPLWLTIDGVEGTAIGLSKGEPCITVFSSIKADELRTQIPSTVEGYPVIIKETGTFRAIERE